MTQIRKTLTVPLPPDAAFRLFTRDINTWWPKKPGGPGTLHMDGHVGGQLSDTGAKGTRRRWGTITRWDPGQALGIAWTHGHNDTPNDEPVSINSVLLVTFTPADTGTRVDLTHTLPNGTTQATLGTTATLWATSLPHYIRQGRARVPA